MTACACFRSTVLEPSSKKQLDEQRTEASTAPTDDEISIQEFVAPSSVRASPTVLQKLDSSSGILILGPDDYIEKLQGDLPAGFTVTDTTARPIELLLNTNGHEERGVRLMDKGQRDTQFNDVRLSLLLQPGVYSNLKVEVGYYSQVIGLGATPSDVKVHVVGTSVFDSTGNHTNSFWRSVENLEVDGNMNWWVSQGTSLRSLVVNGNLSLSSGGRSGFHGWSSGGFLANSHVKGIIDCGNQQQWCSRNTEVTQGWTRWAQIFNFEIGNTGKIDPYSPQLVKEVPLIAEKPRLVYETGKLVIHIPPKRENAVGPDFSSVGESQKFDVTEDMLVGPADTAKAIMDKLANQSEQNGWKALLMLPGEYDKLGDPVVVDASCNVVVMGLGFATLIGHTFGPCLIAKDTDKEVRVASLLFHQGQGLNGQALIQLGGDCSTKNSSETERTMFFYDIFCRTGGPKSNLGSTHVMMQVNAAGVVGDNSWLWTGDHGLANKSGNEYGGENNGKFVDWYADHGLVVEGKDFIQYGLMSEHHKSDMVWFKGENAQIFFYQSELPYAEFDTTKFAYLVDPSVTTHTANCIGAYIIFTQYPLDKSKPEYEAGMSVGSGDEIRVKDLIVMQWNGWGAQHALKAGSEFHEHGRGSSFTGKSFVSYEGGKGTRSTQSEQHDATELNKASGVPWLFTAFCKVLSGIKCCDTNVEVNNFDIPVNARMRLPAVKWAI